MLKNTRPQRASYKREAPDFLNPLHPSVFGTVAAAVIALLSAVPAARAAVINVVDVIPNSDSSEALQNSEPSLGVNPLNPSQMIAGTFGNGPYFKSTNGGTIWSGYGNLSFVDKSIAWRQDGVAALTATLQPRTPGPNFTSQILTYSGTIAASNFGPLRWRPIPEGYESYPVTEQHQLHKKTEGCYGRVCYLDPRVPSRHGVPAAV